MGDGARKPLPDYYIPAGMYTAEQEAWIRGGGEPLKGGVPLEWVEYKGDSIPPDLYGRSLYQVLRENGVLPIDKTATMRREGAETMATTCSAMVRRNNEAVFCGKVAKEFDLCAEHLSDKYRAMRISWIDFTPPPVVTLDALFVVMAEAHYIDSTCGTSSVLGPVFRIVGPGSESNTPAAHPCMFQIGPAFFKTEAEAKACAGKFLETHAKWTVSVVRVPLAAPPSAGESLDPATVRETLRKHEQHLCELEGLVRRALWESKSKVGPVEVARSWGPAYDELSKRLAALEPKPAPDPATLCACGKPGELRTRSTGSKVVCHACLKASIPAADKDRAAGTYTYKCDMYGNPCEMVNFDPPGRVSRFRAWLDRDPQRMIIAATSVGIANGAFMRVLDLLPALVGAFR